MTAEKQTATDLLLRKRWQTLLSVDDMIEQLITRVTALGQMDRTFVIFFADNGCEMCLPDIMSPWAPVLDPYGCMGSSCPPTHPPNLLPSHIPRVWHVNHTHTHTRAPSHCPSHHLVVDHLGQFCFGADKRQPYEADIRVPMVVMGPGIKAGAVEESIALVRTLRHRRT